MICPVCQSPNLEDARFCASCGSPLPTVEAAPDAHVLQPRTPLHGGSFVIEELLGAGGFGLTYRARESALGREVAVKEFFPFGSTRQDGRIVPPPTVSGEEWRRELSAFREEALTLARFSHPAIVRAYAVWAESGTAYFAMEFLRGQSLQKRLEGGKPLPVDEALAIIQSIGEALARVHEAGLLHRDIKPDNILLCNGRTVLIDFGTAREFAADKTTPMTQLLTPGYAPLEQYGRRARFGPFTDVYALAATLYHALSGHAPPPAPDRAAGVELRPLDELNPRISSRLARAIETALEVSVPKRPQTVDAWLDLLRESQKPIVEPPPPSPLIIPTPAPVVPLPPSPQTTAAPFPGEVATPTQLPPSPYPGPLPRPATPASSPDTVYPYAPEIPPDARIPSWFWAIVIVVPVLLFGFWLFYDPARGDLQAFDARLRPVLVQSTTVQTAFNAVDLTTIESTAAGVEANVLPQQQKLLTQLQRLNSNSDEALFSRDQLLDAETDKLGALQNIAEAKNTSDLNNAFVFLKRADQERIIWRADYDYLKHQHRLP
ncbi:serine/threonine-protein kinase PrkC [Abditibacteriota bacterium]|nr:serine/threonine-protein kinase PrkC [Abditibacteriota bacterium]